MSTSPARGHKVEKHHSEGKNVRRTLYYSPYKEKAEMAQKKYSEKATSPNNQKEKREKHVFHFISWLLKTVGYCYNNFSLNIYALHFLVNTKYSSSAVSQYFQNICFV